jgi:hypothetical protein
VKKLSVIFIGLMIILFFLYGCGGQSPESTLEDFFAAMKRGDNHAAYELLSSEQRQTVKLNDLGQLGTLFPEVKVLSCNLEGNTARVDYSVSGLGQKAKYTAILVKGKDGWRINAIATTEETPSEGTSADAKRRTCQSNQRTVDGAIQSYEAIFNTPTYPTSMEDMTQPGTKTLKSIPTCPSGDKPYIWVPGDPPMISCPNDASHTI